MLNCRGNFVPLPTPFSDDGLTLSEIRVARMVRWYLKAGAEGFIVATETGEFTALSFSERKTMVELVLRETRSVVPVLAHVSTLGTSASIDLAQHAMAHGVRAVIAMPPYYGTWTDEEIASHLHAIAAYGKATVVVVDPLSLVTDAVRERLGDTPSIAFAKPGSRSDRFGFGELVCDVSLAAFPIDADHELLELASRHPGGKLAKAALEIQGLECGSPRPPQRRLSGEDLHLLSQRMAPPSMGLSA